MKSGLMLLFCAAFFASEISMARWSRSAARRSGQQTGNQLGASISGNAQNGQGTQATTNTSIQESSVDNVSNSQKGQSVAYMMAAGLAGAAAVKFGICSGSGFTGYAACIAGGILLAMSMQSRNSGRSFNGPISDSWRNVCTFSNNGCNGQMPNPYGAVVTDNSDEAIERARRLARNAGIEVDPNSGKVRTSDGKEIDVNSTTSMAGALGAEQYAEVMEQVKKIEEGAVSKVNKVAVSDADYGIGGGAITIAEAGYEEGDMSAGAGAAAARKPAQVSGLTKNFNGDPIGVAADSIFMMMSRRYKLKSSQKTFLTPDIQ